MGMFYSQDVVLARKHLIPSSVGGVGRVWCAAHGNVSGVLPIAIARILMSAAAVALLASSSEKDSRWA
jgi:hypothetical protein